MLAGVPAGGLGLGATEAARIAEVTAADHSVSAMLAAHQNAGLKVLHLSLAHLSLVSCHFTHALTATGYPQLVIC